MMSQQQYWHYKVGLWEFNSFFMKILSSASMGKQDSL